MKKTYNQPQTLEIKVQSRHLFLEISPAERTTVKVFSDKAVGDDKAALTKGDSWYDDDVWGNED